MADFILSVEMKSNKKEASKWLKLQVMYPNYKLFCLTLFPFYVLLFQALRVIVLHESRQNLIWKKQFALDLEKERELFKMEKETMEIEHKYQMELKQKELDSALGSSLMSSVMTEGMKNPDIQRQIQSGIYSSMRQKGKRK